MSTFTGIQILNTIKLDTNSETRFLSCMLSCHLYDHPEIMMSKYQLTHLSLRMGYNFIIYMFSNIKCVDPSNWYMPFLLNKESLAKIYSVIFGEDFDIAMNIDREELLKVIEGQFQDNPDIDFVLMCEAARIFD